jgi:N-ATPase, AtpR subunit
MMEQALIGSMMIMAGGAVAGLLLGLAYFAHMKRTCGLMLNGASPLMPVAETIVRFAGAIAAFALLMGWGAPAAIGGLAGFTVARQWVLARIEVS